MGKIDIPADKEDCLTTQTAHCMISEARQGQARPTQLSAAPSRAPGRRFYLFLGPTRWNLFILTGTRFRGVAPRAIHCIFDALSQSWELELQPIA